MKDLDYMLSRLKLTTIRNRLDSLLDQAAKNDMTVREAVTRR